jgi:Zn-finger nucleic acid-binding protein
MPVYECKKGCHVSDKYGRCPRCGGWMLSHGSRTKEEVMARVQERQISNAENLAGDKRRLDNSHVRAVKERFKNAEKKYFHELRKRNATK